MTEKVCLRVCEGVCACSWRCGDGIQVLHQALEVGHLLGQLIGLVALRERNRVTARGGGGTGREGGKHLEEGREEKRREERRGGSVRDLSQMTGGVVWVGRDELGDGSMGLKRCTKQKQKEAADESKTSRTKDGDVNR